MAVTLGLRDKNIEKIDIVINQKHFLADPLLVKIPDKQNNIDLLE